MAGRKRGCRTCRTGGISGRPGTIVNAYVRLGSPSRWIVIGQVCIDCHHFDADVSFDANQHLPHKPRRHR